MEILEKKEEQKKHLFWTNNRWARTLSIFSLVFSAILLYPAFAFHINFMKFLFIPIIVFSLFTIIKTKFFHYHPDTLSKVSASVTFILSIILGICTGYILIAAILLLVNPGIK